jgi:hypothetical protein
MSISTREQETQDFIHHCFWKKWLPPDIWEEKAAEASIITIQNGPPTKNRWRL